ncbi:MAG: shikimate dehydrogenase [Burkholderiales bacterium]|jgi:shikimate dehydrogenase|nr:shikimate dehydrogenase [Burkholderiales bacterium]
MTVEPATADRYGVVGHPIAHSRSPDIHAAFARATGQRLTYDRILAPLDGFVATVDAFRAAGGRGLNVTVPFKREAHDYADARSARAEAAGAVNTLVFTPDGQVHGDNTDGAGLVRDLVANMGVVLGGRRVLVLGAGGATQGVVLPLLDTAPAALVIANRTVERAQALAVRFAPHGPVHGCGFDALRAQPAFDVVIDATSAGLDGGGPAIDAGVFARGAVAYAMVYGHDDTAFMTLARAAGAAQVVDGLGMLVEQAAEAFHLWRGVRPDTAAVLAQMRTGRR